MTRSAGGLFRGVFPRDIYTHRSALTAGLLSAGQVEAVWVSVLGEPAANLELTWVSGTIYAVVVLLAFDFLGFYLHYLYHKIGWLWELHKVHHSAEVLTPFTLARFHPLQIFIGTSALTVVVAVHSGSAMYFYDDAILTWTVGAVVSWTVINGALNQFYHSHVWLSYGPLNRILYSPAHHRIHHSALPQHRDKNLGGLITFWDVLFGTHYLPKDTERDFPLGLGDGEKIRTPRSRSSISTRQCTAYERVSQPNSYIMT